MAEAGRDEYRRSGCEAAESDPQRPAGHRSPALRTGPARKPRPPAGHPPARAAPHTRRGRGHNGTDAAKPRRSPSTAHKASRKRTR